MQNNLPPFVNVQGLTEPVCTFQAFSTKNIQQVLDALQDRGIKVCTEQEYDKVKDPSFWILRKKDDWHRCELISPFFSASKFVANVRHVLKIVASQPDTSVVGAISPTLFSQLNVRQKSIRSESDILSKLKERFLAQDDFPTDDKSYYEKMTGEEIRADYLNNLVKDRSKWEFNDDLEEKYSNKDKINWLFRGQQFFTSDKISSYAQFSPRSGRTGKPYAALLPEIATNYATRAGIDINFNGKLMDQMELPYGKDIGFLTIFKANDKNIISGGFGMENLQNLSSPQRSSLATFTTAKRHIQKENQHSTIADETLVSPQLNPVAARYLVGRRFSKSAKYPENFIEIDENDEILKLILDSLAPDLTKTYSENDMTLWPGYFESRDAGADEKSLNEIVLTQGQKYTNAFTFRLDAIEDNLLTYDIPGISKEFFVAGKEELKKSSLTSSLGQLIANEMIASKI
jgi:hypothetical protein